MYLALLDEKEKGLFLGLAYALASADGDYSDEEKAVINGYCQEMQTQFELEMIKSTDYIVSEIKAKSNEKVKKIFIFELIGLAMADGDYSDNERALIRKMEKEFNTEKEFAKRCEDVLNEYITFQERINRLILE